MKAIAALGPSGGEGHDPNYLARDYAGFRRLMLDHLAIELGERLAEDIPSQDVALVEVLAYVADYLSYYQDSVATEAYLATARRRVSVARHARLLGYRLGEGRSARTWVQLQTAADGVRVPRGTALTTCAPEIDAAIVPRRHETEDPEVFETMHPVILTRAHNAMELEQPPLKPGDTSAILARALPELAPGAVLILRNSEDGWSHAARLTNVAPSHASTAVSWHADDAVPEDAPTSGRWIALGNVVLADHGRTIERLLPHGSIGSSDQLLIPCAALAYAAPYRHEEALGRSAASALANHADAAEPAIELHETIGGLHSHQGRRRAPWIGARDLIDAEPGERRFAVEPQDRDHVRLRFGDGIRGRRPPPDWRYHLRYRIGGGTRGNIGPGTLCRMAIHDENIVAVYNPLAARGGADPETIEHAQAAAAMVAGREGCRCVTDQDYVAAVNRLESVVDSSARRTWTTDGSLVTILVVRRRAAAVDEAFIARVSAHLAPLQLIGDRVEIRAAPYVTPAIAVELQIAAGHSRHAVMERVRARLTVEIEPRFGESLSADRLLDTVLAVPAVADARVTSLARDAGRIVRRIEVASDEIIRIDPERVTLTLRPGA